MNNTIGSLKNKKYQTITAVQKGVFLGAEITGVDLSKPLTKENIEEIADAHSVYGVLVFPEQYITSENL
jgi:alpha-ketoglutarate-dependent taurine dioxygenase